MKLTDKEANGFMKRILIFVCLLLLLLPAAVLADELEVTWKAGGSKKIDAAVLTDGSDETVHRFPKGKSADATCDLPEGKKVRAAYVRVDSAPSKIELQFLNSKKKWETAVLMENPGPECVLVSDKALSGRLRLLISYSADSTTPLAELRVFTDTELPQELHQWAAGGDTDVLLTVDTLTGFDVSRITEWTQQGRSITIASLTRPSQSVLEVTDALWEAGLRTTPIFGGYAESTRTPANALKNWGEKKVTATVASWLRSVKPMLLVDGGEVTAMVMKKASANAIDPDYELADAATGGLWAVPQQMTMDGDVLSAIQALGERDDSMVRAACRVPFESAVSSDVSLIPYPDNRDEEGFLTEGEFLFEDMEKGLWAYLSPTLQVEIIQYDMEDPCQRYFVAEVKFDVEAEQFRQHTWVNAIYKNQQIYPQTLAQSSRLVFAVNGDYYPYRVDQGNTVGNIIRDYKVLYNMNNNKNPAFPPLDTMAIHEDGSISVHKVKSISADELLALGDVRDALSFGPYLADDGELRIYDGKNASQQEPRCAVGMVEPGHYFFVDCEGRVPKGPKGMTINQIGMLLYGMGCNETFMLDGGSTSVMIFMGEKLNRTGKDTSVGSPRNQHELFGIGQSELVHTDWYDGKPKK
ncbi:MAG: phosphodiester glycosidase family protein [Clostridiales bacterium]|nr:phosphodiester glycosidase family protein [Clostridiales bacterium]